MELEKMSSAELISLVRRQEQELASAYAKMVPIREVSYEELAQAFPVARESVHVTARELSCVINWLENGCDPKEAAKELRLYCERAWVGRQSAQQGGGELPQDEPRYVATPDEFQTEILHAMYKAAQRGDSVERMHFDVCKVLAQRAASVPAQAE